ncbi:MAG: hypothetical protein CLLPBCKN_003264 [Chroococcidiopsis cubana SAG 39.79]|jgi:uncharacterized membrane protein|uniref:DUF1614 domain-containing protein n=2 Tax=Chroococcidiopsis TaxID=54298 RepID=K9TUT1_CHRTP|nr:MULTISPECIES: DUF1614 domain-containing protein [Chroococcidiopsis]AFY86607.1 protein of unknown function DUF1614 [Chroococcidiopsis thermalis PCC 7203]MDZ4873868.1 hypothetical protein [Chroococcidiopsis cubana SAG 39.79]PSB59738.1 DUF1614 domain-containing protein [Chroococcidiopsis cubana CCALA 043]PSM50452.1 DUF1614 domain-containing protein [Chroococcidiopsis sp. CCALA 051]RUT13467.1 hypothetical protein DSM107010_10900 [Chroococcidiopsis cubana SAG 39.79]
MFYLPVSILLFILLLLVFPFIWFALTLDVVQIAVAKLGFSANAALFLLAAIIFGSTINIPLYKVESQVEIIDDYSNLWVRQFFGIPLPRIRQKTIVALNVGGGLIPVLVALYQFRHANPLAIVLVTAIVTIVSYYAARVVPGIGIQMNPLLAPITAAIASAFITRGIHAAPVAFAGGVLGTLIGADILHLKEIQRMTPGVLSIGGAGVFDGIALCGLFALLLS